MCVCVCVRIRKETPSRRYSAAVPLQPGKEKEEDAAQQSRQFQAAAAAAADCRTVKFPRTKNDDFDFITLPPSLCRLRSRSAMH